MSLQIKGGKRKKEIALNKRFKVITYQVTTDKRNST